MPEPYDIAGGGVWVDVGDDASVVLPDAVLAAADVEPGSRVMVRVVDGVAQLLSHRAMAAELQRMIEKGIDPSQVMKSFPAVDGLIVERRRESLMEEQGPRAQHDAAE
jgi:antitoxin component of MazEF toxin-antitoxin module